MRTEHPSDRHLPQLRRLWQDAFGDTDAFLDCFFRTAYSPDRCLCILKEEETAAALYWIDCTLTGQKLAYLYAVVTHPEYRGRGLCRKLLSDTHALLKEQGYSAAVLVPQKESLRKMYAGMGYRDMGGLTEFQCTPAADPIPIRAVGPGTFAALRRTMVPEGGILQEGEGLSFLSQQLQFYTGRDFLLAGYAEEDVFHGVELLGDPDAAPGILKALGCSRGCFRIPGCEKPFAMVYPLAENAKLPQYLGFAFD